VRAENSDRHTLIETVKVGTVTLQGGIGPWLVKEYHPASSYQTIDPDEGRLEIIDGGGLGSVYAWAVEAGGFDPIRQPHNRAPCLDKYRRTLAHVYVAGSPVADVMIGEGFARAYDGGKRLPWCKP